MDPGALDSWSARLWFRPSPAWEMQVSHGFLTAPEELEPADVRRTTASASWFSTREDGFTALTVAFGRNDEAHGVTNGILAEATRRRGAHAFYGRVETLQVEPHLFDSGPAAVVTGPPAGGATLVDDHHLSDLAVLTAATVGAVRELPPLAGFEIGLGADATAYRVPDALRQSHGERPFSFHVFLRVRPPLGSMGRMWNMRMGKAHH